MIDKLIQTNISLKPYNTFGVDVKASFFAKLKERESVEIFFRSVDSGSLDTLVLGSGSNVLFTRDFEGIVVLMQTKGIEILQMDSDLVWLRVQAGEIWHNLVSYCVSRGWGGIENLALIPGTCGAAPIQNIGAYGVELKDVLQEVEVWDRIEAKFLIFNNSHCQFGYRESIFKVEKNRYVVISIVLRLSLRATTNLSYWAIENYLKSNEIKPTIESVFQAVMQIRRSKLPDPEILGNCGSFFKNPVVGKPTYDAISTQYQNVPFFLFDDKHVKIPAAWLIEQCGWKGKQVGNVACYAQQALVLVNATGKANGQEVLDFSRNIQRDVEEKFGIFLQAEVQVIP